MRTKHVGTLAICVMMALLTAGVAEAGYEVGKGYSFGDAEGTNVNIGADMRLRLTHADRDVFTQGAATTGGGANGPAMEWLRLRTRVWASVGIVDGVTFNARLVNRIHHFSSSIRDPNNTNGDGDGATWQTPDEVILDRLNITLDDIAGSGVSVTVGRQDLILGNGMVLLEGTPRDQGRTIYFDGITATYKDECNKLTAFGFYMDDDDPIAMGLDEKIERHLRGGRIATGGIDWTHNFDKAFNTEAYYIYSEKDDTDGLLMPDGSGTYDDTKLHTFGARIFGTPLELVDYSLEAAQQLGETDSNSGGPSMDNTGYMVDARLTLHAPEACPFDSSVLFQYTYLSGDDPNSTDENEGWEPVFAQYPIWREELLPILFRGDWTNLNQYRVQLTVPVIQGEKSSVTVRGSYAYLDADYGSNGGGDRLGDLYTGFVDYKVNAWLTFSLEAAWLAAGDFYNDGHDCEWLRFQTVITF